MIYYFDDSGWLSLTPIEGRSTTVAPPDDKLQEGWAWNHIGAEGREWMAMERNPKPAAPPPVAVPERFISVGSYFDRFGDQKWPILASTDQFVQALVKDCNVRVKTGINLAAPDVIKGVKLLQAKGFPITIAAVIDAEIKESEQP